MKTSSNLQVAIELSSYFVDVSDVRLKSVLKFESLFASFVTALVRVLFIRIPFNVPTHVISKRLEADEALMAGFTLVAFWIRVTEAVLFQAARIVKRIIAEIARVWLDTQMNVAMILDLVEIEGGKITARF